MHIPRPVSVSVAVLSLAAARPVRADITAISPFSGDLHEPLNFSTTMIVARLPIFGGAAALASFDGQATTIHLLLGDTFGGDTVTPRSGLYILGFTEGPAIFEFNPPVRRFGGYWNNNSGQNDATVQFLDAGGGSLGTRTASVPAPGSAWVWNGWQSDVAVSRMVVTGNGVLHGFLWFEDMELSYVPGPGGVGAFLLGATLAPRRRRK